MNSVTLSIMVNGGAVFTLGPLDVVFGEALSSTRQKLKALSSLLVRATLIDGPHGGVASAPTSTQKVLLCYYMQNIARASAGDAILLL